jgi:hypothetical protein
MDRRVAPSTVATPVKSNALRRISSLENIRVGHQHVFGFEKYLRGARFESLGEKSRGPALSSVEALMTR